jgi:hypothetical protein
MIVGRTIPSYRIATDIETSKWKPFRQALSKKDRMMFDEMMTYPRLYNSAGSNACRPQLIHPILMSIIFEHYKQLKKLKALQLLK